MTPSIRKNEDGSTEIGFTPDQLAEITIKHIAAAQQAAAFLNESIKLNERHFSAWYRGQSTPLDENTVVIGGLTLHRREIDESLDNLSRSLQQALGEIKRIEKQARGEA